MIVTRFGYMYYFIANQDIINSNKFCITVSPKTVIQLATVVYSL